MGLTLPIVSDNESMEERWSSAHQKPLPILIISHCSHTPYVKKGNKFVSIRVKRDPMAQTCSQKKKKQKFHSGHVFFLTTGNKFGISTKFDCLENKAAPFNTIPSTMSQANTGTPSRDAKNKNQQSSALPTADKYLDNIISPYKIIIKSTKMTKPLTSEGKFISPKPLRIFEIDVARKLTPLFQNGSFKRFNTMRSGKCSSWTSVSVRE